MCITGYFVENTKLTEEEEKEDLFESLKTFHIERYPDYDYETMWTWTQEEYDALVRDWNIDNLHTIYIIWDND